MDPDFVHITALQQGDDEALTELIKLHKETVFRFILRYVGNEVDAADLTEETFVKVYFNAEKYRRKAKVKTWIFTIATNLCRDWHRRNKRHLKRSVSWNADSEDAPSLVERQPDQAPSVPSQIQAFELDNHLRVAISQLPSKLKESFILCILEDKTHEECAALLEVSSKTVETRIYRARKHLKQSLYGYINYLI